jgi:alanyl-tRNA synthetase
MQQINVTTDGKQVFSGALLFTIKATHGFPLDFALDRVINDEGLAVGWVEFIEEARRNGWWDFQTHQAIQHGVEDAGLSREMREAILRRFQLYVLAHPHPGMNA